tara:strand:+ start:184 stop:1038 length:855 start_codon:yes stop_codon:yes gene_type:complete
MDYDIVYCNDGVTRAVPIIKGTPQDPSLTSLKALKEEKKKLEKPKVSIQQRINEQVSGYISEIEGKVDDFIDSDFKDKYDCYNHLNEMGCKSVHARKMREFYIECYNETVDVYNADDDYLNEAWGHLKPKYHKKIMDFYGVIVDDIERIIKNSTAQRKPRKKKALSSTKLVSKLKYQQEHPDLRLVSVNPEKIVGCNELWVYNTKYNKLGVYYAENSVRGLSVKGCTIQDFDSITSTQKTARKPEDVLKTLTKRTLNKHIKQMKTKEQDVTGRINAQTILLGAF